MISFSPARKKPEVLRVSRFKYHLVVGSPLYLSKNKGATLRGGFGNALKEVTCTMPDTECIACPLYRVCVYPYLFETPPPLTTIRMAKGLAIPRPFVIEPPADNTSRYPVGAVLSFELVLIGKGINLLPYFTRAFEKLGERGLGKQSGKFKIKTVETLKIDQTPPENVQKMTLHFLSPTRIVLDGHPVIDIDFPLFFRTLSRRISNLEAFHGGFQTDVLMTDLKTPLETIRVVSRSLRWSDQERYSRRQSRVIPQGGFVGEITFEGEMGPFLPYLKLGEAVHVGKGATFGMGRYEIDAKQSRKLLTNQIVTRDSVSVQDNVR